MALKLWIVSLKNFRNDGNNVLSGTSCQCVYGQAVNLFVFVCCRCLNATGWVFGGFAGGPKRKQFSSLKRGESSVLEPEHKGYREKLGS